jgi:hypothetical protein
LFTSRAIRAIGVSRIVPRDRAIDLSAAEESLRSFIFSVSFDTTLPQHASNPPFNSRTTV